VTSSPTEIAGTAPIATDRIDPIGLGANLGRRGIADKAGANPRPAVGGVALTPSENDAAYARGRRQEEAAVALGNRARSRRLKPERLAVGARNERTGPRSSGSSPSTPPSTTATSRSSPAPLAS